VSELRRFSQPYCEPTSTPASENNDSLNLAMVLNLAPTPEEKEKPIKDKYTLKSVEEEESRESSEESKRGDPKRLGKSNLYDAIISDVDLLMDKVYGDHVHQNPGQHLHGGIEDEACWQNHWRRPVVYAAQTRNTPSGAVGRCFVEKLAELLEGIQNCNWNSERLIIFSMVILQRTLDVKRARDIKNRISRRIDGREEGKFMMLIQDTKRDMQTYLSSK
jgi:hypothetical protein